jgi:hypothetical protein
MNLFSVFVIQQEDKEPRRQYSVYVPAREEKLLKFALTTLCQITELIQGPLNLLDHRIGENITRDSEY